MNQILLVLKDNSKEVEENKIEPKEETIEEKGGIEMVDDKETDDLDAVFESENDLQENNISESETSDEDQEIINSYMSTDDDYTAPIEDVKIESELNSNDDVTYLTKENMDLLIDDSNGESSEELDVDKETEEGINSEDSINEDVIQSAEDYIEEVNGISEDEFDDLDLIDNQEEPKKVDVEVVEPDFENSLDNIESDKQSEEEILDSVVFEAQTKVEEKKQKEIKLTQSPLDIDDDYEDIEEDDESGEVVSETTKIVDSTEGVSDEEDEKPISSFNDFRRESFWKASDDYMNKYGEEALNTYLEKYQNEDDNGQIIRDYYSQVVVQYGDTINFAEDEEARHYAWLIACGKFADLIERRKQMGLIETSIEVENHGKSSVDTAEDPNVIAIMKERKAYSDKANKYSIDRTVFAIADDEVEDGSIFEDKKAVDKEFYEGPFYKILKEVMTSDRCANMSKVYMKVIINPDTSFIPIADFSTGVRFVCIDSNDVDQYRIHALALARQVPFSFQGKRRNEIKTRVLYSDMCINRPIATISAIKKLVAFQYWNKKRVLNLEHNFAVAYTTESQYVEMFERGDLDSKNPENCVNISRKPKTCSIGIIALEKKSVRDRQAMRRKQGKKVLERIANGGWYNEDDANINDYNIHFVLGADIVANDRDLVNPALAPQDRCVHYQITRYCECNPVIILDGLQTICTCIIKEHIKKYGRTTKYSIEFEYDPTELLTPGVMGMIDAHDGIEESTYKKSNPMSIMSTYIMPPSRLKMEGVFDFEKGRVDGRNFNAATMSVLYPRELYSRYNLNTIEGRAEFLRSRGFEEFWQPATAVFDIMPYALKIIETGSFITEICDINIQNLSDRDSTDMDNLLYQQQKLDYFKKLDNSSYSNFQRFLFSVLDIFIDSQNQK